VKFRTGDIYELRLRNATGYDGNWIDAEFTSLEIEDGGSAWLHFNPVAGDHPPFQISVRDPLIPDVIREA
jgi:hypothetical protein